MRIERSKASTVPSTGDNDTNDVHYTSAITNVRLTHSSLPCSLVGWMRHSMGSGVCSQSLFYDRETLISKEASESKVPNDNVPVADIGDGPLIQQRQ